MTALSILDKDIRIQDGLYSLNDLHKASGAKKRHAPALFMRNQQTKELVAEIDSYTDLYSSKEKQVSVKIQNGVGTWVCKELVYSYAMWISAKFHLYVIRAFDAMVTDNRKPRQPKPKAGCLTLDQQTGIKELVKARVEALPQEQRAKGAITCWSALKSKFGCTYKEISTELYSEAVSLVARLPLEGEYLANEERRGDEGYYFQEHGRYFADGRAILDELDKYVPGDAKTLLKQLDNVLLCSWTHMDESLSRLKVITAGLEKWRGPRSNLQHPFAQVR